MRRPRVEEAYGGLWRGYCFARVRAYQLGGSYRLRWYRHAGLVWVVER